MGAWAKILFFLFSAAALAETPTPEPSAVPTPAGSLSIERLFGSIRSNVTNFLNGGSPSPTAEPVAEAATPAPAAPKPNTAVASILSIKPEKPAPAVTSSSSSGSPQAGAPPAKVEFDDSQKEKTQDFTDYGGGGGAGGAKHQGVPSKVVGARGKPQAFDKWYPVCLFFDGVAGAANAITKGLTDMAAKCGVNLITYPVFVSGAGGGVNGIKNQAKQKCNATDGFGRFGVNRGSAILVTGNSQLPQQMCGSGDIQHCGEMGWDVGQSLEARLSSTGRWGGAASGMAFGVAVGASLATVAAVLGQTELGLPPGYGAGNGVGEDNEGYASAGAAQEPGWSDYGCQRMRETAFDNDGRWKYLRDREYYAIPPKNGRLYDINGGKPLFNKPKPAPAAGAVAGGGGGGGAGAAGAPAASSAGTGSSGGSSASTAPPPGAGEGTASIAGGHKQTSKSSNISGGTAPSQDTGSGRRELEDGSTVRNRLVITDGPTASSGGGETSDGGGGSRPRAEAEGSGSTTSVYFDDSTKRPTSVGVTDYGTGAGTQVGGALLSAGGAAALKSQLESGAGEEGGAPAEEKEDESKSKKRPTEAGDRKPASDSTWGSVFNGDYFKKIFKPRENGESAGDRRPRVVQ